MTCFRLYYIIIYNFNQILLSFKNWILLRVNLTLSLIERADIWSAKHLNNNVLYLTFSEVWRMTGKCMIVCVISEMLMKCELSAPPPPKISTCLARTEKILLYDLFYITISGFNGNLKALQHYRCTKSNRRQKFTQKYRIHNSI